MPAVPVLLMAQQLTDGGTERQLAVTAIGLDRTLFTPHVGVLRPGGMRVAELEAAGVPVTCFPVDSFVNPARLLRAARALGAYLRRHRIQLVHTFDAPANIFGVPAARFYRTPLVVSSQRCFRELIPGQSRPALRLTDRLADAIVVNCKAIERHLVTGERVAPERIRLCYNAIDTSLFRPLPKLSPPSLQGASLVVGVVCALRPEKDIHTLIRAFAQARAGCSGMRLVIMGDGPERPSLESLSDALQLRADCLFVPASADVTGWLREIDVFVLPSISEALSNSVMEAMACGCAVVASRVGGNPELVAHGERGLLFEPGNVSELAAHLAALASSPDQRRRYAQAGAEFIHANFNIAASIGRMGQVYSELLAGKREHSGYN